MWSLYAWSVLAQALTFTTAMAVLRPETGSGGVPRSVAKEIGIVSAGRKSGCHQTAMPGMSPQMNSFEGWINAPTKSMDHQSLQGECGGTK